MSAFAGILEHQGGLFLVLVCWARPARWTAILIGNGSVRGKSIEDTGSDTGGSDIAKERTGRISKPPCPSDDVGYPRAGRRGDAEIVYPLRHVELNTVPIGSRPSNRNMKENLRTVGAHTGYFISSITDEFAQVRCVADDLKGASEVRCWVETHKG